MLTEAGSDLVRPSVLSMHATSEWCVGLRVESDTYHKPSWPSSWPGRSLLGMLAPTPICMEALAQCTSALSDGTQLFSGFGVAWAHDGATACTSSVVTCGLSAFRGEGAAVVLEW